MTASDETDETISPLKDMYSSLVFLTRLPAPDWPEAAARKLANAMWAFPLAGVAVAIIGGAVYGVCDYLALPAYVSALFAVAAMVLTTGGLHEDGLSDVADGVWGGHDRESRLTIMTDSRIGAYGAIALIISVAGRAAILAAILQPAYVFGALVAAAAASRAVMPVVMAFDDLAKSTGLGAGAGKPNGTAWGGAILIAAIAVAMAAPAGWFVCLVGAAAGALLTAWFTSRKLGGYTGDTLGAAQQVAELFALAAIAGAIAPAG